MSLLFLAASTKIPQCAQAYNRCLQAMSDVWGHGDHIQCMHPAANCIEGREDVRFNLL